MEAFPSVTWSWDVKRGRKAERDLLLYVVKLDVFIFLPWIVQWVFQNRRKRFLKLHQNKGDRTKKLTDEEMIGLCSEFLDAGTDTTSTTL
ncbi:hypothetical protein Taro_016566 [Colocasia esculenta]|uniref:Uncharacterized protein n=1 Tax=Colocasia esculenta TaxID=4460 RepID=A0A843UP43_COLES|nr:hypothetical protein [Colocasia esculenta]